MVIRTERLRDYVGPVTNTDIWDEFEIRSDDVFVVTPPKCGTTWMLNIVMMLLYGRVVPEAGNRDDAPWLDCAFRDRKAIADAQFRLTRRRCIKSHTPLDGISYAAEPTYVVVYRHPIDVFFSFRSHVANMKDQSLFADVVTSDVHESFDRFLKPDLSKSGTDDLTLASIVHHYTQSLERKSQGNVHFFHYADLSRDLGGQISRLANILNISLTDETLEDIRQANTFASMRQAAEDSEKRFHESSPFADHAKFFASGTSNKWEGRLSPEEVERYEDRFRTLLPSKDAKWLNWGERRGSQPLS